jgi:hypothetical protein
MTVHELAGKLGLSGDAYLSSVRRRRHAALPRDVRLIRFPRDVGQARHVRPVRGAAPIEATELII